MFLLQKMDGILPSKIASHSHHNPSNCTPLSQYPSPLLPFTRPHHRAPVNNKPAPLSIKSAIPNRTQMTRIGRISTDFPIRANPRYPCNPCLIAALPVAEAPESHDVICLKITQTLNLRSSMPKPCGFSTPHTHIAKQSVYPPSRGVTPGAFIRGFL